MKTIKKIKMIWSLLKYYWGNANVGFGGKNWYS